MNKQDQNTQIIIYNTADGETKIEVRLPAEAFVREGMKGKTV